MATLSFHAGVQGKMTKQNLRKLVSHTFRKMEHRGKDVKPVHGNEDIDVTKTHLNHDAVLEMGRSIGDIVERSIAERIKRTVRKDAALAREIIVQASPDVYEGLSEEEKVKKSIAFSKDAYHWFCEEFGFHNVAGFSAHHDETNPHTHFVVIPITVAEDGKRKGTEILSQAKMFKGPHDLRRQHREFRAFMNERGWNFDMENKYENIDGVDLHQYKKTAKAVEKKRSEQKAMQAELRENPDLKAKVEKEVSDALILSPEIRKKAIEKVASAPDVRQEAVAKLQDDLFDSVLLGERRALERAIEDAERKREELEAEGKRLDEERRKVALAAEANEELRKKLKDIRDNQDAVKANVRDVAVQHVKEILTAVDVLPVKGIANHKDVTPGLVKAYADIKLELRGTKKRGVNGPVAWTPREFVAKASDRVAGRENRPSPSKGRDNDLSR